MNTKTKLVLALVIWLGLAIVAGASGLVARLQPPGPQIVLFALTGLGLLACFKLPALRAYLQIVPVRALVAYHIVRFVGFYFLWLHSRNELPYAFAVPGGIGDIATATFALMLLPVSPETTRGRRLYFLWNTFGLVDIAMVVFTAARLAMTSPDSMGALLRMPLSLLPTFIVPLIFVTHVLIYVRLWRKN